MKKYIHIFLILIFWSDAAFSQSTKEPDFYIINNLNYEKLAESEKQLLDTTLAKFKHAENDSIKISLLFHIIDNSWDDNVWPRYNEWVKEFCAEKLDNGHVDDLYKNGLALCLNNQGYFFNNLGDIKNALESYEKSLKVYQETNDSAGLSITLNNIGIIYDNQNEIEKAKKYYFKSLSYLDTTESHPGVATAYNNLGYVFDKEGDSTKALLYYFKSLIIYEELNELDGVATAYNNIGGTYQSNHDLEKALQYHQKSLAIREQLGYKRGQSYSLRNIGQVYYELGNINLAKTYLEKALELAQEIGYPENIRNAAEKLSEIYSETNQPVKALKIYKTYIEMRDSLSNEEIKRASLQQKLKSDYEKQKAIAEAEHQKEMGIEIQKEEKQRIIIYTSIAMSVLLIGFLIYVFNRLKLARKQRNIIREQNQKLNVVNKEISEQRDEIVASINYAKLIQNALLPLEEYEREFLPEHFIMYRPKDIVSGDFYWFLQKENYLYIAVADCTGHGVPGGFLTMLGTSFLNEINSTPEILSPAEILNQLREKIISDLSQQDGKNKDGMDISLIRLELNSFLADKLSSSESTKKQNNYSTIQLEWAGANNPLYILRKNLPTGQAGELQLASLNSRFVLTKADRQPIGYAHELTPFTNHKLKLEKGDQIYLFTDGYADQFGGEKGKKLGYQKFREILIENSQRSMNKQKESLESFFEEWKSNESQVDDICVIGLKI